MGETDPVPIISLSSVSHPPVTYLSVTVLPSGLASLLLISVT